MEITITGIHPAAFRRINADSILIALGNKDQSDAEIKDEKNGWKSVYRSKRKTPETAMVGRFLRMEPRGVEPLSEDQTNEASPSAVRILTFPLPDSHGQDAGFSSFIKSHAPQSLGALVPCYSDAACLRRRRLRGDVSH